jgi:hypothetical protein
MAVGATTFGVLFGATMMYYKRSAGIIVSRPATSSSRRTAVNYSALDGPRRTSASSLSPTHVPTTGRAAEVDWQLPLVVWGAISAVVAVNSARLNFDLARFHQQLATVPLAPGKSYFCAEMCPAVIQRRDELLLLPNNRRLWNDPETVDLESLVRLVYHCQLRMEYEDQLLLQHQPGGPEVGVASPTDPSDCGREPVDIPEPGVPLRYDYSVDSGLA